MPNPAADSTFDPTTSLDVQEALSIRHGNFGLYIVPLRSGKFALFDRSFTLIEIYDDLPSADEICRLSEDSQIRLSQRSRLAAELRFYGEPDDRTLIRDIRNAGRVKATHPKTSAIEIEL